jgi:hypothetical protein
MVVASKQKLPYCICRPCSGSRKLEQLNHTTALALCIDRVV